MFENNRFKLLIVDDSADARELLITVLRREGYSTRYACNGVEALQMIEEQRPDLIITDIHMPGVDGFELIRRVREDPLFRFTPILVTTGTATSTAEVTLGAEAGALSYLIKPFDVPLLLARVRTLLEFKDHLDKLAAAAHTDILTGLSNRRWFESSLQRESTRADRSGSAFCLILFDLDRLKVINDTRGHLEGDGQLRRVGDLVRAQTRAIDVSARIGGDEFAVILTGTDRAGAVQFAERLRAEIAAGEQVTGSFGIAEYKPDAGRRLAEQTQTLLWELYQEADRAMYRAKEAGGNAVCCAESEESGAQMSGLR